MTVFQPLDWLALAVFLVGWAGYSWVVDMSPLAPRTLTAAMDEQRARWMEMMLKRELRMVDTAIIAGLQNGTAFFASTSLLAIGAAFAVLTASDDILSAIRFLPLEQQTSRPAWEMKAVGLLAIYAYAFFKFGWSYRLFNYASILIGATPPAGDAGTPEARRAIASVVRMTRQAGRHFSLGQRAFFFSVAFLGWFASAWVFLVITVAVIVALARRQFAIAGLRELHPG